jgi:GDP-4-dehydro-6-deoxy-D-mannose reductase
LSRRALLTGGAGFVGQWLARALLERGDEVTFAGLEPPPSRRRLLSDREWTAIHHHPTDVRSADELRSAVEASAPDIVVHLAGVAFQPDADRDPAAAYDVNALGAVRLLRELARRRRQGTLDPVVLVIGSALQYGRHDAAEMPLTEQAEQRPLTVYAASKLAQEIAALQIFRATGLRVICTRSFNHSGVGHGDEYILPSLARRVAALGATRGTLPLGNDVVRDYLHVADVVDAYLRLVERGVAGEVYNVCSGTGVSVRQLAERVLLRAGASADISTDPALVRESDIPSLVGSPERLMRTTGWTITRSLDDIIDDLLHAQKD